MRWNIDTNDICAVCEGKNDLRWMYSKKVNAWFTVCQSVLCTIWFRKAAA